MANGWGGKRDGSGRGRKLLRWQEIDLNQIEKFAEEGMTKKDIKEKISCSPTALDDALKNSGRNDLSEKLRNNFISAARSKLLLDKKVSPDGAAKIPEYADAGMNLAEIMEKFGYSKNKYGAFDSKQKKDFKRIVSKTCGEDVLSKILQAKFRSRIHGLRKETYAEIEADLPLIKELAETKGHDHVCEAYDIKMKALSILLNENLTGEEFLNRFVGKDLWKKAIVEFITKHGIENTLNELDDDIHFLEKQGFKIKHKHDFFAEIFGEKVAKNIYKPVIKKHFNSRDIEKISSDIDKGLDIFQLCEKYGKIAGTIPPRGPFQHVFGLPKDKTSILYKTDERREKGKREARQLRDNIDNETSIRDRIFRLSEKHAPNGKKRNISAQFLIKREFLKLVPYECSWCGISEWRGKILKLQMDHINGNPLDNSVDNLRLLCPNCHSITETSSNRQSFILGQEKEEEFLQMINGGKDIHYIKEKFGYKNIGCVKRVVKRYFGEDVYERMMNN